VRGGRATALAAALWLAACAGAPPNDQRPLYGGQDRGADPAVKAADAAMVANAIKAFGSKRAASDAFVSDGDAAFRANDMPGAMRLYNQAWLVDKDNPAVYQGFAGVLYVNDEYCESSRMLDAATARGPLPSRMLTTAARVYAGCGITLSKLTEADSGTSQRYYARAEEYLQQAAADPKVAPNTVVESWARYYYGRGDYKAAWGKVAEYQKTFGTPMDPAFVANLRDKEDPPPP